MALVLQNIGLAPVERELAEIVYVRGEASAVEVGRLLQRRLSNSAVRTMLNRLQAKGVLRRRRRGKKFIYAPALTDDGVREAALRRLAEDYFNGSPGATALAALTWARNLD